MEQVIKIFIALVSSEICKKPVRPEILRMITPDIMEEVYNMSKSHDLVHVVAVALKKHKLLGRDRISQKYVKHLHSALVRYEALAFEESRIYKVFEKKKIVYVPLKGSVIRKFYAEPWMRTSCDIDILVQEEELERAKDALVSSLGYVVGRYKYHDISMYSPEGMLVELHFRIVENEKNMDKVLKKVWSYSVPKKEGSFRYKMTPEYLLFHAYAHMLYHFAHGGCGVRYVMDIWLLENELVYDEKIFWKLCKESKMDSFVMNVRKLAKVWFEDEKIDELGRRLEAYIITGGVFGNLETKITARKTQTKGHYRYLLQRIFIPYKEFCASYPLLEKLPFLYPYFTVKRWLKIFNKKIAKNAVQEIRLNRTILQDDVDDLKQLFKELKL